MFETEKDLKRIIKQMPIDTESRCAHRVQLRKQVLSEFRQTQKHLSRPAVGRQIPWRTIMKSPITRTAAMIAVIVSTIWAYYQSVGNSGGTATVLSLLKAASAAENAWFTGEQTVHIVNQAVITPQHDFNDVGLLMKNLESNFDNANLMALLLRVATPHGMDISSLDANGHRHTHHLALIDPQAGEATIEDRSWYDPVTGCYARVLMRKGSVLFGHSFDGRRVYLAHCDDRGELIVQSEPVTASFSIPETPADFLGFTAGIRNMLEKQEMFIRGKPTESTIRGRAVQVYKLSWFELNDKRIPYLQLSVDKNDQSIVRIELVANQKPAQITDHLSMTRGVLPSVGWDLSALPGSHDGSVTDVTVRGEISREGLTVQEMAEHATYPVFVFGKNPQGTLRRTIIDGVDPVSPPDRVFNIIYETQNDVAVGLSQSQILDRYIKAQAAPLSKEAFDLRRLITTSHGFKVYRLNANGNEFILGLLFDSLNKKAAENQNCYLLESPEGRFICLGIDGWLPSNELEQLAESLVLAQDYESNGESLVKTPVDLSWATHSELEHNDYITRWLVLGRFDLDAYGSDPTDDKTKKRAFEDEPLDLNTFTAQVRVEDQDYAWTSCYGQGHGQGIDLGGVCGASRPGICYGRSRIMMPEQTDAILCIKSSDAVKIWLDGRLVHEVWGTRGFHDDIDQVPVTLRAGENDLVFKALHSKGIYWLFSCRFKKAEEHQSPL